jgi:hypothetical protein
VKSQESTDGATIIGLLFINTPKMPQTLRVCEIFALGDYQRENLANEQGS